MEPQGNMLLPPSILHQVSAGGLGKVLDQMLREHPQVRWGVEVCTDLGGKGGTDPNWWQEK